jgi:hypothetical protein
MLIPTQSKAPTGCNRLPRVLSSVVSFRFFGFDILSG